MLRATLSVFIVTLDLAAIAGNAVVILAFCVNKKLRKPSGCYVTNLAAADLFMSLVGIPFYVITVTKDSWPLGDHFCAVWTGLERVVSLVSNFAIVGICFDRYWLVTRSSHYLGKHTVTSARWRIAGIWIAAILFRVPFVIFGMLETWGKLAPMSVCDPHSRFDVPFQVGLYEYDVTYTLIATLGEFVIPLILIIIWGVQVYVYLDSREKQRFIKAVERSRAMSLDFNFPQREMANFYNEERRGSNQSRISFFSRYLTPDVANKQRPDGLCRSRDTIAGPLSDLDEDPHEGKYSPSRTKLLNGSVSAWNSVDNKSEMLSSVIDIVLDPASGGESTCSAMMLDGQSRDSCREKFTRNEPGGRCTRGNHHHHHHRTKSNLSSRKSLSLNTLEARKNSKQQVDDTPKGFPTSKSTPSIVLTRLCDHNVVSGPSVIKKSGGGAGGASGGAGPLQVSFSLEVDDDLLEQQEVCVECQKESMSPKHTLSSTDNNGNGDDSNKTGAIKNAYHVNGRNLFSKERAQSLSAPTLAAGSPSRRRVVREGSMTSTCDFLDVPSSRTHCRPQPLVHQNTADSTEATGSLVPADPSDTTAAGNLRNGSNGLDSVSVGLAAAAEQNTEMDTRNSSFSSCASDLPDSVSSIITVSEPPSPGLRRVSQMDAEEIQRVLNSRAKQRYRSYRRRALMTILLMVCVFVVFQLPYVIVSCVYSFCVQDCVPDVIYELANWWYWAKVLLNPYLYAYISPEFRRYSKGILKCRSGSKNR